jgi:hypothetical protein
VATLLAPAPARADSAAGIYVMAADGSGVTNLTNNPGDDYGPVWSPDGTRIAFGSDRDGNSKIYVMAADGSGVTNLTNNPGGDYNVVWSPDGTRLAFQSDRDGNAEVYVMAADGSGTTNLTNNPGDDDYLPAWSPDSTRIAFVSGPDGNGEVSSWPPTARGRPTSPTTRATTPSPSGPPTATGSSSRGERSRPTDHETGNWPIMLGVAQEVGSWCHCRRRVSASAVDRRGAEGADFCIIVTFDGLAKVVADHLGKGRQVAVSDGLRVNESTTDNGSRRRWRGGHRCPAPPRGSPTPPRLSAEPSAPG